MRISFPFVKGCQADSGLMFPLEEGLRFPFIRGGDMRATAAEWSKLPPLCKGRDGGVESPIQGACSWSTGGSPLQTLPPLTPPYKGGEKEGLSLPFIREGRRGRWSVQDLILGAGGRGQCQPMSEHRQGRWGWKWDGI